jgi:hypothetical protein
MEPSTVRVQTCYPRCCGLSSLLTTLLLGVVPLNLPVAEAQVPRSVELLRQARQAWLDGDLSKARAIFAELATGQGIPAHHREEAAEQLKILEQQGKAGVFATSPPTSRELPELRPAVRFFVAPDGRDENPGTESEPFASLERARDAIRELKRRGLPAGGVAVVIRGGIYQVRQPFRLGLEDSGTPEAPICYHAAPGEKPVFSGGIRLEKFEPVGNPSVLSRLPTESRKHVVQVDLRQHGVTAVPPLQLGGFASGRGFRLCR